MTTPLRDRKCQACAPGTPPLEAAEAVRLLRTLHDGWRIADDGKSLRRAYGFKDFYRTMAFVNAVAWIANIEDHHPDIEVGYNYCRRGVLDAFGRRVSENDFICAAKLDALS